MYKLTDKVLTVKHRRIVWILDRVYQFRFVAKDFGLVIVDFKL